MFRLLGILTLGNLLFGGRHHHRALRRGLFLGALLGYLSNRDFDMNRVREEARDTARKVRKETRRAARTIREEIRNARKAERDDRLNTIRAEVEARKAERETRRAEAEVRNEGTAAEVRALPVSGINEAKEIENLVEDMAKNAGTAAMAADVPTIDFPEDEEKYYASRKYGTVQ